MFDFDTTLHQPIKFDWTLTCSDFYTAPTALDHEASLDKDDAVTSYY
jgi:hypothetical protein